MDIFDADKATTALSKKLRASITLEELEATKEDGE